jgi:biotin carboxyl carrier protein
VRFPAEQLVRAGTDGFVTAIEVQNGEQVVEGQRLAVLINPELRHQVRTLQLQLEQTEQQSRLAREKSAWSEYADQQSLAVGLRKQLAERQRESEGLELRAPCSGRVFHPEIGELVGQYVGRGTSVMTIDDGRKELVISISQDDMTSSDHWGNLDVQLVFPNLPVTTGRLARIHPNASEVVPAPAMARRFGGPLLVQPIASTDSQKPTFVESQNTTDQSARNLKLLVPRITGVVEIPTELQDVLPVGQTGVAFLPAQRQSLASYLVLQTRRWLNGHLENMRQSMR